MKIYLGPAGVPATSKNSDTISGIKRAAELSLKAMEIEFVRGVKMGNELAKEAGEAAKKYGIRLSVHAPYFINLCNPAKVKDSQKRILDSCERAHHMGAWIVVFHPGYYGKLESQEAIKIVAESCEMMSNFIEKKGWNVYLGLETTGKMSQFGTVDEILTICKKVKNCAPVVDWAHLYAKYQGNVDYREILSRVIGAGYKKIHTHFSNIEFGSKGEKRHLTMDHKKPDFAKVAKVIMESRLEEITIISESPVLEMDSLVMKKELEKLGYRF